MRRDRWVQRLILLSFLTIYFSSGFSALLYQVIWQRMLALFSGADVFATTTIVASFMAGLGVGSLYGGSLADRVSSRRQIALFSLAECLTGIAGLLSKWWCYDVLYSRFGFLASAPLARTLILFASLLVPTFLMGMTLPLLSKALTPAVNLAGARIGSLYALNTLGAACGAFVTGWVLMGRFPFPEILRIGAAINFGAAGLALVLGFFWHGKNDSIPFADAAMEDERTVPSSATLSFPAWAFLYALSGFLALSLEIVWFRLLGIMLKSNSLTFPHLLGIYLTSLALGIMIGVRFVKGNRPAQTFLALQSGITIYAGLSISVLIFGLNNWGAFGWLRDYFGRYEPVDTAAVRTAILRLISGADSLFSMIGGPHPNFLSLYLIVPIILIGPSTLMMGISFPFLQRAVQNNSRWIGRRVGWLQAANIFGATLGAIAVGGFFLRMQGTTGTLRLLIGLGGMFLVLWFFYSFGSNGGRKWAVWISPLAIVALVIWSMPSRSVLWGALHGSRAENVISAEDGSGLSLLKNERQDFLSTTFMFTNGLGQSWIPYTHVNNIHSLLGVLPVLLHQNPREIAVIGLGSGNTLYSVGGREETTEIFCIEIVRAQIENLQLMQLRSPYPALKDLLKDSRMRFVFRDGRTYIASSPRKYDIIQADALRPSSAFAGNLYSHEYFQMVKSRLKPGGFAVSWGPTQRVIRTFLSVFPHVLNFDSILIGSAEPIEFDREAIRARMNALFTRTYYQKMELDLAQVVMPFFERPIERLRLDHRNFDLADINGDLFPKDEYAR